jgi:hypothetical protein
MRGAIASPLVRLPQHSYKADLSYVPLPYGIRERELVLLPCNIKRSKIYTFYIILLKDVKKI